MAEKMQNVASNVAVIQTPRLIQQNYYEFLGHQSSIVWDFYDLNIKDGELSGRKNLERKVGFALFGPPKQVSKTFIEACSELDMVQLEAEKVKISSDSSGYDLKKQFPHIKKVCDQIILQTKHNKYRNELYISIIFVVCVTGKDGSIPTKDVQNSTDVKILTVSPVFRVRKCVPAATITDQSESKQNYCHLFIDEESRVYEGWAKYLKNNHLPKSRLVVPLSGIYNGDENDTVNLFERDAPSCHWSSMAVNVTDTAATVTSVGATCILLASLALPVAAVAVTAATVTGAAVGAYSAVRSSTNLADRSQHQQSIGIRDAEARGSWLGIVGGVTGVVTGAASKVLSTVAGRGVQIGAGARMVVNATAGAGVVVSGVGAIYGVYQIIDMYCNEGQRPSVLMLFQVSASVLFFTNSVVNFKTAGNIIEEKQANVLDEYKASLRSNRHRKMFNKMQKETVRTQGESRANAEIIRSIQNIANRDDFFAGAVRINRNLNANGARISFSADGTALLNGVASVDPMQFWAAGTNMQSNVLGNLPPPVMSSSMVTQTMMNTTFNTIQKHIATLTNTANVGGLLALFSEARADPSLFIMNSTAELISMYLSSLAQDTIATFMSFFNEFISQAGAFDTFIKEIYPRVDQMTLVFFEFLYKYLSEKAYELLRSVSSNAHDLVYYMEQICRSLIFEGKVNVNIMNDVIRKFGDVVKKMYIERINTASQFYVRCKVCSGVYYVHNT